MHPSGSPPASARKRNDRKKCHPHAVRTTQQLCRTVRTCPTKKCTALPYARRKGNGVTFQMFQAMKTVLSSLLALFALLHVFTPSYGATELPGKGDPGLSSPAAPCWAEAHYYGLAQDEHGDPIAGCHIVLVLIKCQLGDGPAPILVAWGFVAVGACPQGVRAGDEVFYASNGTQVAFSAQHKVSNDDTLPHYLRTHADMKVEVADAAVGVIPD